MYDHNELEQIRAEVEQLKLRDERREREHTSLLKSYGELAADQKTLRRDTDTDYELLGKAFDDRIASLKPRSGAGEPDGDATEDFVTIYRGLLEMHKWINQIDERQRWWINAFMRSMEREARAMGIEIESDR